VAWSRDSRCPDEALARVVHALKAQGVVATDTPHAIADLWQSLDSERPE